MTPGQRIERDEHMVLSFALHSIMWGVIAGLTAWWPAAIASAALVGIAMGFGIDLWLNERRIKRWVREDMRRYDEQRRG